LAVHLGAFARSEPAAVGRAIPADLAVNSRFLVLPASVKRMTQTDAAGRLTNVTEYQTSPTNTLLTAYTYDSLDDLTGVNQSGLTRSFAYDSLKRLLSGNNPETGTINYAYDNDGNLITKTDAKGTITCFGTLSGSTCGGAGYDALNRPLVKSYSDGTPQVNWSWDTATLGIGHLTSVAAAGVSTTSFSAYDGLGRPLGSTQTTAGTPYTFAYSYYPIGLNTVKYPSNRQIAYTYDIAGRIASVGGAKTYASGLTYASFGGLQSLQYGNNLYEQTCYNNRLQPTAIWVRNANSNDCASPNSSDLLNLQLGYPASPHNNGNLTSQNIYASSSTPYSQSYTYGDGLNRLSSATETSGWTQTYVYDAFGNRAVLAGAGQYIPNPGQTPQTTSTSTVPYNTTTNNNQWTAATYDSSGNGNMTNDGLNAMTYYADNMLKTSSNSNNGSVTYFYDGDGHRVQKVVAGGASTTYVYDAGGQLAAEYSTASPPVLCTTCWFTADHLGSTRLMTDSSGVVQRRYDFLPFGEEIPQLINGRTAPYETSLQLTTPDVTDWKFTAKPRDSESGLDFFGARYFSGAQGRYTTPDWSAEPEPVPYAKLTDPQSLNLYSYVRNNPLSATDADGHCTSGGEQKGFWWCLFHYSDQDALREATGYFNNNAILINGKRVDPSKMTDQQLLNAWKQVNDAWKAYGGALSPNGALTAMLPGAGLRYEPNPKHGTVARGDVSPEPTNPETTLENSIQIKDTSTARVGVDPATGEYVMFRETGSGTGVYHGYATKEFNDLPNDAKAALQKAGMVTQRGAIAGQQ